MIDLGKHAVFIWASYGAVAAVIAGLIAWLMFDSRRQRTALEDLERRGVRRRSSVQSPESPT